MAMSLTDLIITLKNNSKHGIRSLVILPGAQSYQLLLKEVLNLPGIFSQMAVPGDDHITGHSIKKVYQLAENSHWIEFTH